MELRSDAGKQIRMLVEAQESATQTVPEDVIKILTHTVMESMTEMYPSEVRELGTQVEDVVNKHIKNMMAELRTAVSNK